VNRAKLKHSTRKQHQGETKNMMSERTRRRGRIRDTVKVHRLAAWTEAFERQQGLACSGFFQGTTLDDTNYRMVDANRSHLADATIMLFDSIGAPQSTGTTQFGWAASVAFRQYLLREGNCTVVNYSPMAHADLLLSAQPKKPLSPKDRAPENQVHGPFTLDHRLTHFGIVIL
jgi:hypothetical protein